MNQIRRIFVEKKPAFAVEAEDDGGLVLIASVQKGGGMV